MRRTLSRLVSGLAIATLISCNSGPGYTLSGTVENAAEGQQVYLAELNQNNNQTTIVDTLEIVNGKFEGHYPSKNEPTVSFLTLEGVRGNVLFIAQDEPISMEVKKDSLFASKVSGGTHNQILYEYLGEVLQTNEKIGALRQEMMQAYSNHDSLGLADLEMRQQEIIDQDKEVKREVVGDNPNSIVSVLVLQDMVNSKTFNSNELIEFYNGLSEEVRNTHLAYTLEKTLESLSRLDVGSKAPDFTAPTPDGQELALEDVLGEVTLVDFWASWCRPCRIENPNIVRVYEKYHDKGFNVLGVSLDRPEKRAEWLQAIEDDNLTWPQVSNLMFWQDPIARLYNIQAIPAAFLLDKDGTIIARDLRGDDLERKVAQALGEE